MISSSNRFASLLTAWVLLIPWLLFPRAAEPSLLVPAVGSQLAATSGLYFAATGHSIDGTFLDYWQSHGGLPVFGYPLTEAFYDGGYLVQYFERSRFELHPENAGSPYEVLLGQLGAERLRAEKRKFARDGSPAAAGEVAFPETGYKVEGAFLAYWQGHGGLPQFGYPISPEVRDGESGIMMQYFERARFELHSENAGTQYEVLLTLLGVERAASLDPVLRDPWPAAPTTSNLRISSTSGELPLLSSVKIESELAGEVRVLGGDNHLYATYPIGAEKPLSVTLAGVPGQQSFALYRDGRIVAALWGAVTVGPPELGISTGDVVWDGLYPRVKGYLARDVVEYTSPDDAHLVRGYRSPDSIAIWLRDHVHQLQGARYFEPDMKSALEHFRNTQRDDGSFDDFYFHTPATPVFSDQIEVEADREYLIVEGVWLAWQATGDDAWLREMLPAMERGLEHTYTDPRRWSAELGLVKRAFTIDTWDYEQGSDFGTVRRTIDEHTRWGIMHGDNTGVYQSSRLLASMERYFGRWEEGADWDAKAEALRLNLNRVAWNGHFYTHQVHLTPVDPHGADESAQLSLSNAYALNRGTLSHEQAVEVLRTYQARRVANAGRSFAEWYSIDPPFPKTFDPPGDYINGGIMPLVGGELARGAFEHGFEAYGADILRRYWDLTERTGGSYLWYHPEGNPGLGTPETLSTDGWGSSAMLNALTEGLAGVVDGSKLYEAVTLSPRWAITSQKSAEVALSYGASGAYFAYNWQLHPDGSLSLTWGGKQTQSVKLHMLLLGDKTPSRVLVGGEAVPFTVSKIEASLYLDVALPGAGSLDVLY
ncbi:MAG: hypothetical protein QOH93_2080 [Chloroflexia bacterium]|nr:hypothetical protein [Chloroflexia bacterium]